jgi:hypothetical protein
MVDTKARIIFSRALARFAKGTITNFEYEREFESQFPADTNDLAILRIRDKIACLYSDLNEHKLDGDRSPVAEVRAVIDRCILFLHTDLEYEWPKRKTLVDRFLQVLNLGRYKTGVVFDDDFHFWPFIRETDYLKASKRVSAS